MFKLFYYDSLVFRGVQKESVWNLHAVQWFSNWNYNLEVVILINYAAIISAI